MLDLMGVQEVRWEGRGNEPPGENTFLYVKGNENQELGTGFFCVHKRIISAVKKVELVSDRISYIILRGHWSHNIVLNVHAPTEDTRNWNGCSINSLNTIRKFCRDFKGKEGRKDIFKPTIWNESLHKISNGNGVRVVNFATSKNLSRKYDVPTLQHPQLYCILASCYIRLTLNICSFVHQCNTFTSYIAYVMLPARRSTWLATSHRQKLA
jgi:hypothetical protein